MKAVLYAHGGSGNHGCEAIVRSTAKILKGIFDEMPVLVTDSTTEDKLYGIDSICKTVISNKQIKKISPAFIKAYIDLKLKKQAKAMDALLYRNGVLTTKKGDIAFSIGGDNYCYKSINHYIMLHEEYKKRGAKTVLWGCSVEPELLYDKTVAEDIARYDLITAREPFTYEALKAVNPNTVKVADPAFLLDTATVELPKSFVKGNTVGINLSPMVIDNESIKGIAFENYLSLCRYILKETNMSIALIPHVVWESGDDRIPLKQIYDELNCPDRVCLIEDCSCEQLKGYIAACRFFVASRTHASIAAYSSCVPTLVVGYSIKAKGIATDLFGTDEGYVLPVQKLANKEALLKAFIAFADNETKEKNNLNIVIPSYKRQAFAGVDSIKSLL